MTDVLKTPFDETQKWSVEKEKKAGIRGEETITIQHNQHIEETTVVPAKETKAKAKPAEL